MRSLDILKLEDTTRKLDIVIRAEKRGFVEDYRVLIELKDLRNELVHEYIQEAVVERFKEFIEETPVVIDIVEKINRYIDNLKYCDKKDYKL